MATGRSAQKTTILPVVGGSYFWCAVPRLRRQSCLAIFAERSSRRARIAREGDVPLARAASSAWENESVRIAVGRGASADEAVSAIKHSLPSQGFAAILVFF